MENTQTSNLLSKLKFLSIPLSGATATYIGDLISYPFEIVSVLSKKSHPPNGLYQDIFKKVLKKNWRFFTKGIDTVFYSAFFTNFVYFGVYEGLSQYCYHKMEQKKLTNFNWTIPTLSSLTAEFISLFVLVPIDCVQTRIQSGDYKYKNFFHGIRSIRKNEGFLRFFMGIHVYMIHNMLFIPIMFTIYEEYKRLICQKRRSISPRVNNSFSYKNDKFSILDSVKGTLLATTISTIITNPLYTILVRFQMTNYSKQKNKGIWSIIKRNYNSQGLRGLNVGLVPRICAANLSALVYLPIFEVTRTHIWNSRK
jgi:hypothetical protein